MAHYVFRVVRQAGIAALFIVAALAGTTAGALFAYAGDLPEISALDDYAPSTITRLYAANGQVIGEFATQRRTVVAFEDIAPRLRQAIMATEDAGFDRHFGLSISRILIALFVDVVERRYAQGASTLTQQLARNLYLSPEQTAERKIKEALIAVQIEKRYTKREIFTFYANQVYFGHGAYGVEAASRLYFSKSAKQLTLPEAATIAAIIQAPERLSPFVDPRRARQRRNYVLQRMTDEHYISKAEAEDAARSPVLLTGQVAQERSIAPYFVEEIRKGLEQRYGAKRLYESGLSVQTTLDVVLQEAANAALDRGLRALDKRHNGYRKPRRNLLREGHRLEAFTLDRWSRHLAAGDIVPALVTDVAGRVPLKAASDGRPLPAGSARLRMGRTWVDLPRAGFAWTRKAVAADLLAAGDLIEVRITKIDQPTGALAVALEQPPLVEGAVIALDNRTGQVRAMVGGWSFARSKFNRATQAYRQMGSAVKPIVYTAAIDRGFTPATIIMDEPVSFEVGPNQPLYQPQNYDRTFEGPVTLRRAVEDSRNVPAVKVTAEIGPSLVAQYAKRFGFSETFPPYLSIALGSTETTLLESTSAYTVFPHQGVRMKPYSVLSVRDRDGQTREENRPEPQDAIRADTAYILTSLLRGVVLRGTAAAAGQAFGDWPLAGKTGTMDEYTDAWFIGFDPQLTVGVWVGYDEKKSLGRGETGASAALPIWMDVMRAYLGERADKNHPPQFEAPGNIVTVTLADGRAETFISGTQPQ